MDTKNIQVFTGLFEAHLHTIDLALYLVGSILVIVGIVSWVSVKRFIINRIITEVTKQVSSEKVQQKISDMLDKKTTEAGEKLYKEIQPENTKQKGEEL